MRKLILFFTLFIPLFSCQDVKESTEYQSVLAEKNALAEEIKKKDQELEEFTSSMNQIEDNLIAIREEELNIENIKDGQSPYQSDRITLILAEMDAYLEENKTIITKLETKLKNSQIANAGLRKMLAIQKQTVLEKERQIAELTKQVASLKEELVTTVNAKNAEISMKNAEITTKEKTIVEKDISLNTAYYVFGTRKELLERGIIQTEGGVIGPGNKLALTSKFDIDTFKKINIQDVLEINIGITNRQKAVSAHPTDSYYFVKTDGQTYLKIVDHKKFWSISKYLVIVTDS